MTTPLPTTMGEIDALRRVDTRGDVHPVDLDTLHVDHAVTLDISR